MKTVFILLIATLALASATQWQIVSEEFDNLSLQPADLEGWKFENNYNGNELSYCGDVGMVGGYQIAGKGARLSKKYTELPSHYKIKIKATVFFLDSWDNEKFEIQVNGKTVFSELSHQSWHSEQLCGIGTADRIATLEAEVAHFSDELEIAFTSNLNEQAGNESWGLRDFEFSLAKCEDGCQEVSNEFSGDFDSKALADGGWTLKNDIGDKLVTECQGQKMLGGYKTFGKQQSLKKVFKDLPKHYKVIIGFKLWQLDSWDTNEKFRVVVDDKSSFSQVKSQGAHGGEFQCENSHQSFKDTVVDVSIELYHYKKDLTVALEDFLNENTDNESWGVSDFRLYTIACEGNCAVVSEELDEDSFNGDAVTGWTKSGRGFKKVGSCTRQSLVGGYNILAGATLSKTFKDLPAHNKLIFSVEVWFLDSWDNEDFTIAVDQVASLTTTKGKGEWRVNIGNSCGNTGTDEVQELTIEVPHFGDVATVDLISKLNQAATDESWGFREVKVYVVNEHGDKENKIASQYTKTNFENKAKKGWTVENPVSATQLVTNCGGQFILGGYNTFSGKTVVSRTWDDLPEHDYVTFYFKVYFLDTWDNEAFIAKIDGAKQKQLTKLNRQSVASQQLCGAGDVDEVIFTELTFSHTGKDLELQLYTMLNEGATNESWGIRDFHAFVGKKVQSMPDCPTLYSECNYEGEKFNLCDNVEDFSSVDWQNQVKSVWVPEGWSVTLFEDAKFEGKKHDIKKPIECLEEGPKYQFIRVSAPKKLNLKQGLKKQNHLKIQKKKHHLRKL